jgi:hypothetical protein
MVLALLQVGCATNDGWKLKAKRWGKRGVGALGSYVLHEACHLAVGAAFGADIRADFNGRGLNLTFSDISNTGHRVVAVAGNVCTGVAAELILYKGWHEMSDVAWGMAAFHASNSFGYAFANDGDASHWTDAGGSKAVWQSVHAIHGARVGAHLAWDAGLGDYVLRRWGSPPPDPNPLPNRASESPNVTKPAALLPEAREMVFVMPPWPCLDSGLESSIPTLHAREPLAPKWDSTLGATPRRRGSIATLP